MLWKTPKGSYIESSNIATVYIHKSFVDNIDTGVRELKPFVCVNFVGDARPFYLTNSFDTSEKAYAKLEEICKDINNHIFHYNRG